VAFERYFLRKVRTGSTDPAFERLALRLMGIEKLERLVSRSRL
jgi:sulfide:quinone oxidoreductase